MRFEQMPSWDAAEVGSTSLTAFRKASQKRDILADARRPDPDRARVLRLTHRQQLGQQARNLAERRQHRIPGCDIGQFGCNGIPTGIQDRKALRPAHTLTSADEPPADPDRHVAGQGANPRLINGPCWPARARKLGNRNSARPAQPPAPAQSQPAAPPRTVSFPPARAQAQPSRPARRARCGQPRFPSSP